MQQLAKALMIIGNAFIEASRELAPGAIDQGADFLSHIQKSVPAMPTPPAKADPYPQPEESKHDCATDGHVFPGKTRGSKEDTRTCEECGMVCEHLTWRPMGEDPTDPFQCAICGLIESEEAYRQRMDEGLQRYDNGKVPATLDPQLPENMPELDSKGTPWDARIHSSSKNKIKKTGEWKKLRNPQLPPNWKEIEEEIRRTPVLPDGHTAPREQPKALDAALKKKESSGDVSRKGGGGLPENYLAFMGKLQKEKTSSSALQAACDECGVNFMELQTNERALAAVEKVLYG